LSVPAFLTTSSLNTPDDADDAFAGRMFPGAPMDDAPVLENGDAGWLLNKVGQQFVALYFAEDPDALDATTIAALSGLSSGGIPVQPLVISRKTGTVAGGIRALEDARGIAAQRYDAKPGTLYLLRPDQHVAARWRSLDAAKVKAAVARATCNA
jgi:3-(3-hydroxy-phenyl)propionate hydroxylase